MCVRYRLAYWFICYFLRCRAQRAILIVAKTIMTLLLHVEKIAASRGRTCRHPLRCIPNLTIRILEFTLRMCYCLEMAAEVLLTWLTRQDLHNSTAISCYFPVTCKICRASWRLRTTLLLGHRIYRMLLWVHQQFEKSRRQRVWLYAIVALQIATTELIWYINNCNSCLLITLLCSTIIWGYDTTKSTIQVRIAFVISILHHGIRHHLVQAHREAVVSIFCI